MAREELNIRNMAIENTESEFVVLGMMSGTSLDGLDLAVSHFSCDAASDQWESRIDSFCTIPIPTGWKSRIKSLQFCSATDWHQASCEWSSWCAKQVKVAIDLESIDLVVFSGQTVFHRPESGWTGQLGSGAELFAGLGLHVPVVCDLRSLDVSLGGQGAPLVPVADALLYPGYEACLNLGGFANVSYSRATDRSRIAWDIGPCNLVLNDLASRLGHPFDESGQLAAAGNVHQDLWSQWMALPYHFRPPPKSLGGEWIESEFWPVLKSFEKDNASDAHDLLATATAYIASQIRLAVQGKKTLVTGGGVYNTELLELLKGPSGAAITGGHVQVELPESDVIEGKEAHAFGFLGLLRALGKDNVWNSVTGAAVDHMGGALWGNFSKRGA